MISQNDSLICHSERSEESVIYDYMTLIEAENAIIEEFSMYEEWLDKYEYIIELGKSLKNYPEESKTDDKLIKGCQSRVWLDYKFEDGRIVFNADSDRPVIRKDTSGDTFFTFFSGGKDRIEGKPVTDQG